MKNRFLAGVLWALLIPATGFSGYKAYEAIGAQKQVCWADENSVFLVESELARIPDTIGPFDPYGQWAQNFGTAFLVNRKAAGLGLITAWHVIDGIEMPVSVHGKRGSISASFTRIGTTDLAWAPLTAGPDGDCPEAWKAVPHGPVSIGIDVQCWGFPEAGGLAHSNGIVRGRQISRVTGLFAQEGSYINMDAEVIPGMSGGPVVDANGYVIAVVVIRFVSGKVRSMAVELPD